MTRQDQDRLKLAMAERHKLQDRKIAERHAQDPKHSDPARAGELAAARDNAGEIKTYIVEAVIAIKAADAREAFEIAREIAAGRWPMSTRIEIKRTSRLEDYRARQEDAEYDREESSRPAEKSILIDGIERKVSLNEPRTNYAGTWILAACPICGREYGYPKCGLKPLTCGKNDCRIEMVKQARLDARKPDPRD